VRLHPSRSAIVALKVRELLQPAAKERLTVAALLLPVSTAI